MKRTYMSSINFQKKTTKTTWRQENKQECIPVGCVPPAHWPWRGEVPAWGLNLPRGLYLPTGGVPAQEVYCLGGVPAWGWGCTCLGGVFTSGGMYLPRGACTCPGGRGMGYTCPGGCTCPGGVPAWGCTCPEGGCTYPGGVPASDGYLSTPPTVDRILDTCYWKYYLAPTLLWAVITPKTPKPKMLVLLWITNQNFALKLGLNAEQWKGMLTSQYINIKCCSVYNQ